MTPAVTATVLAVGATAAVVAAPTHVTAGTLPAPASATAVDLPASPGPVHSQTLSAGLAGAAAGQRALAAHRQGSRSSLRAGVDTTEGARTAAREVAVARAFHEPVLGARQTSGFGWRWGRMHQGLDLAAAHGTPLYAVGSGWVQEAGWNNGLGYHVRVRLDSGELLVYGHLSRISVPDRAPVRAGTVLGAVGSTGRSTGAHLHLEVRTADGPIDPGPWLAARRGSG